MNYQKIFDTIGWMIVVICAIGGFIFAMNFFAQLPNEKEVEIQLLPGEIPPNTERVFDVRDVKIIGNITNVSGTYDFYQCNQTFVSVNIVRKSNVKVVEFYIRGTTPSETFDYHLYKDIPPTKGWGKYSIDSISSFNDEKIIVKYYGDVGLGAGVTILILAVIAAIIAGGISCLVLEAIKMLSKGAINGYRKIFHREKK